MGVSTKSLLSLISFTLMILIINNVNAASAQYSDLPPPPEKPDKFTSKQQLKEYLVKLHEYYAIIGRPRFGRSEPKANSLAEDSLAQLTKSVFHRIDQNKDGMVSENEVHDFILQSLL